MKYKNWIALFSQTGCEVADLSEGINREPDFVITNADLDKTLITLNGWLRIVPASKCSVYNIYNGHPGLITKYPELKGKDPQKRAWENIASYAKIGSVVHKVAAEVDAGEVIVEKSTRTSRIYNLNKTYNALRKTSFDAWLEFLKEHL